jgi:hypothetical protein
MARKVTAPSWLARRSYIRVDRERRIIENRAPVARAPAIVERIASHGS